MLPFAEPFWPPEAVEEGRSGWRRGDFCDLRPIWEELESESESRLK